MNSGSDRRASHHPESPRSALLAALLPQHCVLCGAASGARLVCGGCDADLPRLPDTRCPVCAVPMPAAETCGACLRDGPAFAATTAAFAYAYPVDALVRAYKYGARLELAHLFADGLVEATRALPMPDLIVPMPIAPARLAVRGFNQANEVARRVARAHAVAMAPDACLRTRDGPAQASLPLAARATNVRNAFAVNPRHGDIAGLSIAVVDDVMTTGATLNALAGTLRTAGAARVTCWVVARTPPP